MTYERQNGSDMEISSYALRPMLHEPTTSRLLGRPSFPDRLPFTKETSEPQMARGSFCLSCSRTRTPVFSTLLWLAFADSDGRRCWAKHRT